MPELPEVETIRLGLIKYLIGRKIVDVEIRVSKLFFGDKKNVIGAKIIGLKHIGKGLIIELDNDFVLAVHLKMTGQLIYSDNSTKGLTLSDKVGAALPSKYSHIIFKLQAISNKKQEDAYLYYNDLRRFGWVKVVRKDELMQIPFFKEMGPEPLFKGISDKKQEKRELTLEKFEKIISSSNIVIKVLLMDQKKIGGIGNIYANDALFEAKIDPRRKAKTLTDEEIKKLYNSILKVLQKGLDYGGSSDENFVNALGQEGNYQNHTLVYGKEGEKCPVCGGIIRKIKLGGRGTYFCSKCQH